MARHRELGLTDDEYELIVEKLEREPNEVELAVFSLMWSEHCGYKHSRRCCRRCRPRARKLILGPGENAGAVAVGDGPGVRVQGRVAQPPERGRAVPGRRDRRRRDPARRLRDRRAADRDPGLAALRRGRRVRALALPARARGRGHRPLRQLDRRRHGRRRDLLRGPLRAELPRQRDVRRADRADKLIRSAAAGVGNVVVLFGARTGRDGIGGASVLASAELGDAERQAPDGADRRPVRGEEAARVLAGAARRGAARRAAGPRRRRADVLVAPRWRPRARSGSTSTCARVPLREADMEPFEIMISRVPGADALRGRARRADEVLAVCARWEVNATAIGEVTDSGRLRVFDGDELVGDLPVGALVDECPAYDLEPAAPARRCTRRRRACSPRAGPGGRCSRCSAPRTSRRAGGRSSSTTASSARARCGAPRRPTPPCCALATDGARASRSRSTATAAASPCDPYRGAVEAVLECAANLACVGAEPLGLTNCLNFGNPEKPHIAWQLTRAVAGLGDACRALGVPVVGGNVSLYNEGGEGPIYPTPVVGMVGELPDAARAGRLGFAAEGDAIALVAGRLGAVARRVGAGQAARRGGRGRAPARRPRRAARAARRDPPGRAHGRAALRARRRRGRRRGRAGRVLPRGRPRRARRPRGAPSARRAVRRGPGRVRRLRLRARRSPLRRRRARDRRGRRRRAGDRRASSTSRVDELSRAHAGGLADLLR